MFDALDKNKSGIVPFIYFENVIRDIEKAIEPNPELLVKVRKALYGYAAAIGFHPSLYQTKPEFVANFAYFIEKEVARVDRGEDSILIKRNEVMFELVAESKETISLEESLRLSRSSGHPDSYTHTLYDTMDKEKTGKLNRKELSELTFTLWCSLESPEHHDTLHSILETK